MLNQCLSPWESARGQTGLERPHSWSRFDALIPDDQSTWLTGCSESRAIDPGSLSPGKLGREREPVVISAPREAMLSPCRAQKREQPAMQDPGTVSQKRRAPNLTWRAEHASPEWNVEEKGVLGRENSTCQDGCVQPARPESGVWNGPQGQSRDVDAERPQGAGWERT